MSEQGDPREFDPPALTAPGWYRDPAPGAPAFGRRYWDGAHWTDQLSPQPPKPVARPTPYVPPTTRTSGAAAGAAATPPIEAQLATLPPPTGLPLERAPQATASWPPAGVGAPPPPPPGPLPKRSWYSNGLLWWAVGVAVLVAVAIAVIATRDDGSSATLETPRLTAPKPVDVAGQPNVIAYVDPSTDAGTMTRLMAATTRDLAAKALPFSASADTVNHAILLTPNHPGRSQLEIFDAASLLQGKPSVLGVQTPTTLNAPYCGTVPSNQMDATSRAVAHAFMLLQLGEQDLDFSLRRETGDLTAGDLRTQIAVDEGFRRALTAASVTGPEAAATRDALATRALYDTYLDRAAQLLARGDGDNAHTQLELARDVRDNAGSDALDRLIALFGFPPMNCRFTTP
jgi:Protein of unknown function (DUF2510)